jgi:hypothetical protein
VKYRYILPLVLIAAPLLAQGGRWLEGVWSGGGTYENRFTTGNHERFRARNVYSLQVTRVGDDLHGRLTMTSTIHVLDGGGHTVKEYDADLRLRRDGGQVLGDVLSARRRENNGDWRTLENAAFSAKMVGRDRMDVGIDWERSRHGRIIDNDNFTLERR